MQDELAHAEKPVASDPSQSSEFEDISALTKAVVDGAGPGAITSNVRGIDDSAFGGVEYIQPLYPPAWQTFVCDHCSALGPPIRAVIDGTTGHGHRWAPAVDLTGADADKKIRSCILAEKLFEDPDARPAMPSDEEVAARRAEVELAITIEQLQGEQFLRGCTREGWDEFKRKILTDFMQTGTAYFEVLRNTLTGRPIQCVHAPSTMMRIRASGPVVKVTRRIKVSDVAFGDAERYERFRSYVQVDTAGRYTYFREWGDPRPMNKFSGQSFPEGTELSPEAAATEIVCFANYNPRSVYGVPVWTNALMEALGVRAAAEVNYDIFDNKSVPPLIITVSGGGRLREGYEERIAQIVKSRVKGRKNYHATLVLEADPPQMGGGMVDPTANRQVIDVKPLQQPTDGTHLAYMELCEEIVARQFALSPAARGKFTSSGMNRATAQAAREHDEERVYRPLRARFDELLNQTIFAELGLAHVQYVANGVTTSDMEVLAKLLQALVTIGAITPGEARPIAEKIIGENLPTITAPWTKQPLELTKAGIPVVEEETAGSAPRPVADPGYAQSLIQRLEALTSKLNESAGADLDQTMQAARAVANEEAPERIEIALPRADWEALLDVGKKVGAA